MLRQPLDAARDYDTAKLRGDLIAGLSVAVVAVPQSLAYAVIAGVPPQYGLYTLIVQSVLGAWLNSQPLLSVGPTNTQSLLVAAIVTRVVVSIERVAPGAGAGLYLELVVLLTLLKGLLQVGLAAIGLGALVRYVSQAVILGFTAGAGVLIAVGQVPAFLGIEAVRQAADWPGLLGAAQRLVRHLADVRGPAVGVGLVSLATLLVTNRLPGRLPGPLLAVAVGSLAAAGLGLGARDLGLVGALPGGLPELVWPSFDPVRAELLLGGAMALALLGLMEAYSIGKTLALRSGEPIRANQELWSQGVTHVVSSFFGCIPGSGSFARSALNHRAGARTLYAGLLNGLLVGAMLLAFADLGRYVPLASLAAVLFVIAYGLVDWRGWLRLRGASPIDFQVALGTFAATLLIPLAYAVFVGVVLNIALYLRHASRLHLAEMVQRETERFDEQPLDPGRDRDIVFLQLTGDLFFGLADELEERLGEVSDGPVRVVVIRLKRTLSMDATVLGVLERFVDAMHLRGGHVVLCGVAPELARRLRAWGLVERIGEDAFFPTGPGVFASARLALARARELAGVASPSEVPG